MISRLVIVVLVFCIACSSSKKSAKSNEVIMISESEMMTGLGVMATKDCITCHKVPENLVGPSFESVANRYPATQENIQTLARKIRKGGAGEWGKVPMTPHRDLTQSEAEKIVKYILSLKTN